MRAHWIIGAALTLLVGCGGTSYQMTGRGPATGADAQLAIEETGAGNRQLQLQVSHLPPPERLGAEYDSYDVWVAPEGGAPTLIGRLDYDRGSRQGRLTATTPHERFRLIVTPESRRSTAAPTGVVVLDQYVGS